MMAAKADVRNNPTKDAERELHQDFKMYPERWLILLSVFVMNVANNILWIGPNAVASISANYYHTSVDKIDLLGTIGFIVSLPFCLIVTFITNKFGLRTAVGLGTFFTFAGGLCRLVSSLPGIRDNLLSLDGQFMMCLVGQALNGIGNPFGVSVPTKVAQNWFAKAQIEMATTILVMSPGVGISLGTFISPILVTTPADIPLLNWVSFIPSAIAVIMFVCLFRRSNPLTPPSRSAAIHLKPPPFIAGLKALFTNRSYLVINFAAGGIVGYFNCMFTQMEQFACSRGYDVQFSGYFSILLLVFGMFGFVVLGIIASKFNILEETAKVSLSLSSLFAIGLSQGLRKPNADVLVASFAAMVGMFGFGMFPIALELSVENTYPVDQAAGSAFIFFSGQVQSSSLIAISRALERPLTPAEESIQTCNETGASLARDHTNFLMFSTAYVCILQAVFAVGLKTTFKRSEANKSRELKSTTGEI